uniref:NAD(P)-binding domain-containing protein n=1 Tax=Helicotheca tamesis TaxID=374047 RepID=A0A7S2GR70_9STRA|mmetsp:Transcript_11144/g.15444  ORF Transcript_11144/g.15444 Transcript_11144/m.15444 type:complete len:131 (+) Transcript_11144:53-445(+)
MKKERASSEFFSAFDEAASSSSFTMIRPGGLEEPKTNEILGPSTLEISQGDVLTGIVSRADLAEVSVEIALSSAANLRNTALELYYTDSAQPCEGRFKSFLSSGEIARLHGGTYEELFRGVQPNIDFYQL